jgi:hypothetical protein
MSGSQVNSPDSYPTLNVTGTDVNSNVSITPNVTSIEITQPENYPKLNLTIGDYPSLTVLPSPEIIIGGGGGNGGVAIPGPKGDRGNTGSTGATGPQGVTGSGYTGAFISGYTLYMVPILDGVPQTAVPIGTVGVCGGSETLWTNSNPTLTTVGGLNAGATLVGYNSIRILERILYPYQSVSFNTFSANLGTTLLELNQTISSASHNFTWATSGPNSNWTNGSVSIIRTINGGSSTTLFSGLNYNSYPQSFSHPSYQYSTPTTLTFTISGSQAEGSNPNTVENYYWLYKVYWGSSTSPSISNFTGFNSEFASDSLLTARNFVGDGTQKYYYFVIPSSFTSYTSFKDTGSGFQMAFESSQTISVTNAYGLSITYKYYRSTNSSAASATVLPSIT